jgi:hypothetical protein
VNCYSSWIRIETISAVTAVAQSFGVGKTYTYIIPKLAPYVAVPLVTVTRDTLVQCLKQPLSRREFSVALATEIAKR